MNICVVSSCRSDFGLLRYLLEELLGDSFFNVSFTVTGAHLSHRHDYTVEEVEEAGFDPEFRIPLDMNSDSALGVTATLASATNDFGDFFCRERFDCVVLLGDRYEILGVALAAMVSNTPIAHIHGGELTLGLMDDAIRHSLTKMSKLHFVTTETYRQRVIQLGEEARRVFNVGGLGVDSIVRWRATGRFWPLAELGICKKGMLILFTWHPVTLESNLMKEQLTLLFSFLKELAIGNTIVVTAPNADTFGSIIAEKLVKFAEEFSNVYLFNSLGMERYLSVMSQSDFVLGNSSSGILEAPAIGVPSIDIGNRQLGRVKPDSVVECELSNVALKLAVSQVTSKEFLGRVRRISNPYGRGGASKLIKDLLKDSNALLKSPKTFVDMSD